MQTNLYVSIKFKLSEQQHHTATFTTFTTRITRQPLRAVERHRIKSFKSYCHKNIKTQNWNFLGMRDSIVYMFDSKYQKTIQQRFFSFNALLTL
jgi:hypothetical protein